MPADYKIQQPGGPIRVGDLIDKPRGQIHDKFNRLKDYFVIQQHTNVRGGDVLNCGCWIDRDLVITRDDIT